jgi:hypothetical protein
MERRQGSIRSEAGGEALTPLYQTPTQSPVSMAGVRGIAIADVWWRFVASFWRLGTPGGVECLEGRK